MKKIIVLFLAITALLTFTFTASASYDYRISDDADLLTDIDEERLQAILDECSKNYFEVIIVTTNTLGYSSEIDTSQYSLDQVDALVLNFSESYYSKCGFQPNQNVLILTRYVNQYDKYLRLTSFGELKEVFDEFQSEVICNDVADYLKPGEEKAYDGFERFVSLCQSAYNSRNDLTFGAVVVALIVALIISLIIVLIMKGKLKSVRNQDYAANYLKKDSFHLTDSRDIYLYRTVTRVRVQSNSSNGGRSGGSGGGGGGVRR